MRINIGKLLWNRAYLNPDMEASISFDYRFNFRQLNERSNQFASYLKTQNIKAGDRIAILCKSNEHVTTVMFGAAKVGVITLGVNWRFQPPEMIYILNDAGVSLLVYDSDFSQIVDQIRNSIPASIFLMVDISGENNEFEAALLDQDRDEPVYTGFDNDTAVMMYTSGTTGKPKGAMLTHSNLFWAAVGSVNTLNICQGYRFLLTMPMFHIGGVAPVMYSIHRGFTCFYMPNFDPVKMWDVITAEKINFTMTVPVMLRAMLQVPDITTKDLSCLKFIMCGGSAVPQDLIMTYDNMGIKIHQVYGITEYTGNVSCWTTDMGMDKSNSMGKTILHAHVKILSPESEQELPLGVVGEICCAGPQIFKGYWNNPEATIASIRDGYYRSGDLGKIDEDGFIYVVDRLKDMIISGGENIYPAELEQVIMHHKDVAEVAVVGKPDSKWGEIPVAMIVPKPGVEVKTEEITALCRKNMAAYKCVKEVQLVDALPRTATGKVLKEELRARLR